MPSLREIVDELERHYDPAWAEPWDTVGLVCGDPAAEVRRVHLAVDPVAATAAEAIDAGAQLLVTHHPLWLGGTSSVAAVDAKGTLAHRLITSGVALYVAHTNADVATPGVSDALADTVGLHDCRPLQPTSTAALDKLVTFAPADAVDRLLDAMGDAGAGTIGDYTRCAFIAGGIGTFRPGPGSRPTIGEPGRVGRVEEVKIETVLPRARRAAVVKAMLAAHPYEEPAFDVFELASVPGGRGLGRVGELRRSTTLAEFAERVAQALPSTAWGVRAAGHPRRPVRTVAVCGGTGGALADAASQAGADVLLTADLKHHATSEQVEAGGVALLDAAHWATEWPWLAYAARCLPTTVEATVSTTVTDPWTVHTHPTEAGT